MLKTKGDRMIAIAALGLLLYTSALALTGQMILAIQENQRISNSGQVEAIGVGVYWNSDATSIVTSIDWGTLEPGASANRTCYIQNDGNSALTLSMNTSDWDPSNAPNYISLIWDYDGQLIDPDEIVPVTFTLSISDNIEGITSFSFLITIEGTM